MLLVGAVRVPIRFCSSCWIPASTVGAPPGTSRGAGPVGRGGTAGTGIDQGEAVPDVGAANLVLNAAVSLSVAGPANPVPLVLASGGTAAGAGTGAANTPGVTALLGTGAVNPVRLAAAGPLDGGTVAGSGTGADGLAGFSPRPENIMPTPYAIG